MTEGLFLTCLAFSMAASMPSRSLSPCLTHCVCHPYDSKRARTSSVKAQAVSPSTGISQSQGDWSHHPTDRDVVVVVDHDEVAELQVAGNAGSFTGDTFHGAAIAEEAVRVVGQDVESRFVEFGTRVSLSYRQPDGVGKSLAQRTRRHLDTGRVVDFRMAGRDAVNVLVQ